MNIPLCRNLILLCTTGLLCSGCRTFIVNGQSASVNERGTRAEPYKTIARAIQESRGSDTIVVVGNQVYSENITLKRGQTIIADAGTVPTIAGQTAGNAATISCTGRNTIEGFRLTTAGGCSGLGVGIRLVLDTTELSLSQADVKIRNNELRCYNRAIEVTAPSIALAANQQTLQVLHINHNLFDQLSGNAIEVSVVGPSVGALNLSLDVRDNLIRTRSAALRLSARGEGGTPGGNVRTQISGFIENNLIIEASNGIQMDASERASVSPFINNNTIDLRNDFGADSFDCIDAETESLGSVHPTVQRNIFVGGRLGYQEIGQRTSASILRDNIFFDQIQAAYFDEETGDLLTTEARLNDPIVNGQVVFFEGDGNRIVDPRFASDPAGLAFFGVGAAGGGNPVDLVPFVRHFLQQNSVAINSGSLTAANVSLNNRTTRTDRQPDAGVVDRGFHYLLVEGPLDLE